MASPPITRHTPEEYLALDRGLKFALYRRIATLRGYVLVAQDRMSVEIYQRDGTVPGA